MAVLPNPEVLFLDEPFEAINPATSKIMRDLLVSAAARGVTVFLTSHILPVVERIAHQFVMIRGGRSFGTPRRPNCRNPLKTFILSLRNHPLRRNWIGSGLRIR